MADGARKVAAKDLAGGRGVPEGARGAPVAYSRSLDLRDNPEVRARLKGLGPALLTAHPLAGPSANPDEFCKTFGKHALVF